MLQLENRITQFPDALTNLDYVDPRFMMRFAFDHRVSYGGVLLELDGSQDPRFNNLNVFVEKEVSEAAARRLILINPVRYSEDPFAQEAFEKYGAFPAGVHPCEGIMAAIDIDTHSSDGYPTRLVIPPFSSFPPETVAELDGQDFYRHSRFCRTNKMEQLPDEALKYQSPLQRYVALQKQHAFSLLANPDAFRGAFILRM